MIFDTNSQLYHSITNSSSIRQEIRLEINIKNKKIGWTVSFSFRFLVVLIEVVEEVVVEEEVAVEEEGVEEVAAITMQYFGSSYVSNCKSDL
jgi:hypothetical protein